MSRITIDNYEAFLLDMAEGTITPADREALMLFLAAHPELDIDLEGIEYATLEVDSVDFSGKENLKKTPADTTRFDVLAIKQLDEKLTAAEEKELQNILAITPALAADLKAYGYTKLQADTTIAFAGKDALKQGAVVRPLYYYVAAAASIVLLIGLFVFVDNSGTTTIPTTAKVDTTTKKAAPVVKQQQLSVAEAQPPINQNTARVKKQVSTTVVQGTNTTVQPDNNILVESPEKQPLLVAINSIDAAPIPVAESNETAMGVVVPMPHIDVPVLEEDKPGLLGGLWAGAKRLIKKSVKDDEMSARIDTMEERGLKWDDLAFIGKKITGKKTNIGPVSKTEENPWAFSFGRYTITSRKKD